MVISAMHLPGITNSLFYSLINPILRSSLGEFGNVDFLGSPANFQS